MRKEAGESDTWTSIMNYFNFGKQIDTEVIIKDYYAVKGKTYDYKVTWWDSAKKEQQEISLGTYEAKAGLGELEITPGKATYNDVTKSLKFSILPTYEPSIMIGNDVMMCISYVTEDYNNIHFYDYRIKNNSISLSDAIKDTNINTSLAGKTANPGVIEFRNGLKVSDDGSWLNYHTYYYFSNDDNYPKITFPEN